MAYILIVEDDAPSRNIVTAFLEHGGHRVCCAWTGESALRQMRIEKPDLVLLDMWLEGSELDGWEVARIKSRDSSIARIPVIIVTGLSFQEVHREQEVRLKGAGMNPLHSINILFEKPYDASDLLHAIEMLLGLRRYIERY